MRASMNDDDKTAKALCRMAEAIDLFRFRPMAHQLAAKYDATAAFRGCGFNAVVCFQRADQPQAHLKLHLANMLMDVLTVDRDAQPKVVDRRVFVEFDYFVDKTSKVLTGRIRLAEAMLRTLDSSTEEVTEAILEATQTDGGFERVRIITQEWPNDDHTK